MSHILPAHHLGLAARHDISKSSVGGLVDFVVLHGIVSLMDYKPPHLFCSHEFCCMSANPVSVTIKMSTIFCFIRVHPLC